MNVAGAALAALSYAKTVQVSAMTACYQIAERSLVLCKDSANERKTKEKASFFAFPAYVENVRLRMMNTV